MPRNDGLMWYSWNPASQWRIATSSTAFEKLYVRREGRKINLGIRQREDQDHASEEGLRARLVAAPACIRDSIVRQAPIDKNSYFDATSVLVRLFMFMGKQGVSVNPILYRTLYLVTPRSELPVLPPTTSSATYQLTCHMQLSMPILPFKLS